MNDCLWIYIACCEGKDCRDCGHRKSVNSKEGCEIMERYKKEVRDAIRPIRERYEKELMDGLKKK